MSKPVRDPSEAGRFSIGNGQRAGRSSVSQTRPHLQDVANMLGYGSLRRCKMLVQNAVRRAHKRQGLADGDKVIVTADDAIASRVLRTGNDQGPPPANRRCAQRLKPRNKSQPLRRPRRTHNAGCSGNSCHICPVQNPCTHCKTRASLRTSSPVRFRP